MLSNYYKRKNKRRLYRVLIFLAVLYPVSFALASFAYLNLSLYWSPLNLISFEMKLQTPGYFSSDWKIVLDEESIIHDGIDKVHYDLRLYHGPIISKKAFDTPLPFYQRLYPVFFKLELAEENAPELADKGVQFDISLSWNGDLVTSYGNFMWRSLTSQNFFKRYNDTDIDFSFNLDQNQRDNEHNTILKFHENWTFLGHKDFSVDVVTRNIQHPLSNDEVDYLHFNLEHKTSEPRSDVLMKTQALLDDKTAIDLSCNIEKFYTKRFNNFYKFNIDDLLNDFLSQQTLISLNNDTIVKFLESAVNFSEPKSLSLNYSLAGHGIADYIDLKYSHVHKYSIEADVSHQLSIRYYDLLLQLAERSHQSIR